MNDKINITEFRGMSRSLDDLHPFMKTRVEEMLEEADKINFELLVYCTARGPYEQARIFRKGRGFSKIQKKAQELEVAYNRPDLAKILLEVGPQKGKYVRTKAGPGQSYHQYGLAIDAVPIRDGELVWRDKEPEDLELWEQYGKLAEGVGLMWGGRWFKPDRPHAQIRGFDWRKLILEADEVVS